MSNDLSIINFSEEFENIIEIQHLKRGADKGLQKGRSLSRKEVFSSTSYLTKDIYLVIVGHPDKLSKQKSMSSIKAMYMVEMLPSEPTGYKIIGTGEDANRQSTVSSGLH